MKAFVVVGMINKKHLVATAVVVGGLAIAGFSGNAAFAANGTNKMNGLVTAIAQKFNLNQTDVQKVFDAQRAQMQADREQTFKDKLAELVTAGTLTQEQADKIVTKKAELESERQANQANLSTMTKQERQDAIKAQMDALKQWATDNNIPLQYLRFAGGMGHGHMKGGMHGPKGMIN
jgi:outer membrane murein-binding lipoprotein Lpp